MLSDDLGLQDVLPAAVKDDGVAAEHVEDVAQTERQLQILLDEPSEGLAPVMVAAIREAIVQMRTRGIAVLLVEQNLQLALGLGDVFYVLSRDAVVFHGS
ncbi:MAG: hypothetical protein ACK5AT_18600, partial [Bradyrhizobium sp.]